MKVHDLQPAPGLQPPPKRVGRGIGGKGGKTAGRGTKGQKARNTVPAAFEGGQMPLHSGCPSSRASTTRSGSSTRPINLDTIAECGLDEVSPESLVRQGPGGQGPWSRCSVVARSIAPVTVKAHAFSPPPRRPSPLPAVASSACPCRGERRVRHAKGNQFTNR
jgi:large subunit ribosomal protein L15